MLIAKVSRRVAADVAPATVSHGRRMDRELAEEPVNEKALD